MIGNTNNEEGQKQNLSLQTEKIKNNGTGAGGSNTNKNGLQFETMKDLSTEYSCISIHDAHKEIQFNKFKGIVLITGKKNQLRKFLMKEQDSEVPLLHGAKEPDTWFIKENILFIVEMKFQQGGGSVVEKLQTSKEKIRNYRDRYPLKEIVYIYCLSDWFRHGALAELYYLKKDNIPYYWGENANFKDELVDYIINYKSKVEPM
jgi:hypothetical protein